MNDQIETAVEATSDIHIYTVNRRTAVAVAAFATYGAYAVLRDGTAKLMEMQKNRKAKKADQKTESDTPEQ